MAARSSFRQSFLPLLLVLFCALSSGLAHAQQPSSFVRLSGHVPQALRAARPAGPMDGTQMLSLAIVLPLRNEDELDQLIESLYNPSDPLYGHYLTPDEFASQFSPSVQDYEAVASYCQSRGLVVTGVHDNRLLLDVAGPAEAVEQAFDVGLNQYQGADGRAYYGPNVDPAVPAPLVGKIAAIAGLDNVFLAQPHSSFVKAPTALSNASSPLGTGVGGPLAPNDIRLAYSFTDVPETGSGQTLGLFELAGYSASDIQAYAQAYSLPVPSLTNVLVDSASGKATGGGGQLEVTMDIELMTALAPNANGIIVYEGPNSGSGILDTYNKIATADQATEVSTSWGGPESQGEASFFSAENSIFKEMAAQGQSLFAAAGDTGAYDNGSTLSVDDPASQPYVTGTGGTSLSTDSNGHWASETCWNDPSDTSRSPYGYGGGGGVSIIWPRPSWQSGVGYSSTMRNVPDVCLDADPNTGYSAVIGGSWYYVGGTSAAAPLWAALTALVNQRRLGSGLATLGMANPSLYAVGESAQYTSNFHDIDDGSTNLYYKAVPGYDDATGWGSFIGDALITSLAGGASSNPTGQTPAAPTELVATGGNAQVSLSWSASAGASSYLIERATGKHGSYAVIASNVAGPAYVDTGLTNGQSYFYAVYAVNSAGTSTNSNVASATPMPPVPAAPTGVVATPGNGSVALAWSAVPWATTYQIKRSRSTNGPFTAVTTVSGTSFTNTGLTNGVTYYFVLTATNISGQGPSSLSVSATPQLPAPAAPANLTAAAATTTGIALKWSPAAYAGSYAVYRSTSSGGPYSAIRTGVGASQMTDGSATAGTPYYYVVSAANRSGTSGFSNEASATAIAHRTGSPSGFGSF